TSSTFRSSVRSSPRGLATGRSVIGSAGMDEVAWLSSFPCNKQSVRWIAFIVDCWRGGSARPRTRPAAAMQAIHVFWTAPYRARGIDVAVDFIMAPVERLVLAASVLIWRTHSGPVTLFTDTPGGAFVERLGIADLWSKIDCVVLDSAPEDVDPAVFWDLGKTLALSACAAPVAILDLD